MNVFCSFYLIFSILYHAVYPYHNNVNNILMCILKFLMETLFILTQLILQAPLKCRVLKYICCGGTCKKQYSGEQDCLFFLSKQTCVADELAWDFISRITNSKCSFTAFCNDMSRIYRSVHLIAHPFLSRSTFLSWWFAWLAAHDIYYRKDVDKWCGQKRRLLACDGTHVGVPLSRLHVTPIENPVDNSSVTHTCHKRYDRVFLYYPPDSSKQVKEHIRIARLHLNQICLKTLHKDVDDLTTQEFTTRSALIIQICSDDPRCRKLLSLFLFDETLPSNVDESLARVFLVLSGDAPVSAFVPPRFHAKFIAVCNTIKKGDKHDSKTLIDDMMNYCPEYAKLLYLTLQVELSNHVIAFLEYLIDFVRNTHRSDEPAQPASVIPDTYDPESGVAYYFTDHGCRVRNLPSYEIDIHRHKQDLFDDPPDIGRCNKLQAKVSSGGFNYTFFWFLPIHGHCLGFHLMPGFEGRKDPFSSLYQYLEEPPEEVFYDFACSLNEYCLNREPQFFINTRFWHDLFHGYSHKCGPSHRSSRIASLNVVDTEICEQLNAFLQNIKYTGSHLTQSHFCLYLQFMIHIWNQKKDLRCAQMGFVIDEVNAIDS